MDEKSQIQALDRTLPILPLRPGIAGTTDPRLRAALNNHPVRRINVLDGTVIGQCHPRHDQQEFPRFLDRLEAAVDPALAGTGTYQSGTPPASFRR